MGWDERELVGNLQSLSAGNISLSCQCIRTCAPGIINQRLTFSLPCGNFLLHTIYYISILLAQNGKFSTACSVMIAVGDAISYTATVLLPSMTPRHKRGQLQ